MTATRVTDTGTDTPLPYTAIRKAAATKPVKLVDGGGRLWGAE